GPRQVVSDTPTQDLAAQLGPAAATRAPTTSRRWLSLAVAGVGLVVSAIVATLAWTHREAAQADSGFIIVQAPTSQASPIVAAQTSVPSEPEPEVAPTKREPQPRSKKPIKADAAAPLQLMAADVARAFVRQKAKVIGCLDAHPDDMQSAPQLTVNVTVTANGAASDAHLLPEAIADKPVSGCVTAAVLSMSFPPQVQPTTFRIPLLWRRK
ncbi:MAG TPA: hypothetical protein VGI70_14670, partial [Polyangiales bacterium]